jgi:hypothetical protein
MELTETGEVVIQRRALREQPFGAEVMRAEDVAWVWAQVAQAVLQRTVSAWQDRGMLDQRPSHDTPSVRERLRAIYRETPPSWTREALGDLLGSLE